MTLQKLALENDFVDSVENCSCLRFFNHVQNDAENGSFIMK